MSEINTRYRDSDEIEKDRVRYRHAWEKWTEKMKIELKRLFEEGNSIPEISEVLGRSPNAIRHEAHEMGILKMRGKEPVDMSMPIVEMNEILAGLSARGWSEEDFLLAQTLWDKHLTYERMVSEMGKPIEEVRALGRLIRAQEQPNP